MLDEAARSVCVCVLKYTVFSGTFIALRVYCCTMYDMTAHFAWLKQNKTAFAELVSYLTFDLDLLHGSGALALALCTRTWTHGKQ